MTGIIRERWGAGAHTVLDVSCGIGTQAIGLANRGFAVTASDLSESALARARLEAQRRGATIDFSQCDMRAAYTHHRRAFDVVISGDNSITHLLNDDDLLCALGQIHDCTKAGGGCLLTVRDYQKEERGRGLIKPYRVGEHDGKHHVIFQVWDYDGDIYDMAMYFVVDDGSARPALNARDAHAIQCRRHRSPAGFDAESGFCCDRTTRRAILSAGAGGDSDRVNRSRRPSEPVIR